MAGKRGSGQGKAARRKAQLDRLAATSVGAGDARRARERAAAADAAAAAPSAARWLVPGGDRGSIAVDVVADLLRLGPRASLQGRGSDRVRRHASTVAELVALDAVVPSGRSLAEVLVTDPDTRAALRPALDLDALLRGGPVRGDSTDRTVRVAEALLERAAAHREGRVDLHEQVAPVGVPRHPQADEVEATVRVAVGGLAVPAGADPAVSTVTGGWIGVDVVELFLAAGRGVLAGTARDVGGAALASWFVQVGHDPAEPRWDALRAIVPVDARALLEAASARAGSDHPDVVGAALVELITLRHPVTPPG